MCRSIKTLRGTAAEEEEIRAAALQFVRKVSGYHRPSRANAGAFEAAVDEVAAASRRLLGALATRPAPQGARPAQADRLTPPPPHRPAEGSGRESGR